MAEYFTHVCETAQRWDEIAYRYYGDATLMHFILAANSELLTPGPAPLILRAGTTVTVPVLVSPESPVPVPPWRA